VPFELKCQFKILSIALANEVWMKKLEIENSSCVFGGRSIRSFTCFDYSRKREELWTKAVSNFQLHDIECKIF
jgi:hypothetical protein